MDKFEVGTFVAYVKDNTVSEGHVVGYTREGDLVLNTSNTGELYSIDKGNLDRVLPVNGFPLRYKTGSIVHVTKEMTFDSCHNLLEYEGACANLHGHTYKIQVTFSGYCDERGFVVDFKDIKKIMKESVVDKADHNYLNKLMAFNTTAENMACYYYDVLTVAVNNLYKGRVNVESVKLWETPTSFAEYKGE